MSSLGICNEKEASSSIIFYSWTCKMTLNRFEIHLSEYERVKEI